jgi:hypothetical protein
MPIIAVSAKPGQVMADQQPLADRLPTHPQPPRDRADRRPLRRIILRVLADQPYRLGLRLRAVDLRLRHVVQPSHHRRRAR